VTPNAWVAIALLGRVRGNRGELAGISLGSKPERFQDLQEVWLFGASQALEQGPRFEVESVWLHDGRPIFKFRGVDTISDAQPLAGAEVCVPLSRRAPLAEGEFYQSDLVGCEVVASKGGETLGHVTGLLEHGGPGLLEVRQPDGAELLVPFARAICVAVDTQARRILVDLPEGLRELNRP
jgi:16S rRNA processing protein RimM